MYLLCKFYQHLGTLAIAHRLHIAICRQLPACPQRPGWDLQPLPAEVKFTHRVLRGILANQQYMKPGQEPYCMAWWYMIMICDDCIGYGSKLGYQLKSTELISSWWEFSWIYPTCSQFQHGCHDVHGLSMFNWFNEHPPGLKVRIHWSFANLLWVTPQKGGCNLM